MRAYATLAGLFVALATAQPSAACSLPIDEFYTEPLERPHDISEEMWVAHLATVSANQEKAREVRAAWTAFEDQERRWAEADQVFLARIDALHPRQRALLEDKSEEVQDIELTPLRRLKGNGVEGSFVVGITGWSSCGPTPAWDAFGGKPGDLYVVYARHGVPSQQTILDIVAIGNLVESQARDALGLHQ